MFQVCEAERYYAYYFVVDNGRLHEVAIEIVGFRTYETEGLIESHVLDVNGIWVEAERFATHDGYGDERPENERMYFIMVGPRGGSTEAARTKTTEQHGLNINDGK